MAYSNKPFGSFRKSGFCYIRNTSEERRRQILERGIDHHRHFFEAQRFAWGTNRPPWEQENPGEKVEWRKIHRWQSKMEGLGSVDWGKWQEAHEDDNTNM
jgi:hypothetical protein